MGFWVVGLNPTSHQYSTITTFPMSNLNCALPVYPGNGTAWILTRPPVYPTDRLSRRFRGRVLYRLVWVGNWSTICKWSNGRIPFKSLTNGVVDSAHGFLGRGFESHHLPILNYHDFPHVELEQYSSRYSQEIELRGY